MISTLYFTRKPLFDLQPKAGNKGGYDIVGRLEGSHFLSPRPYIIAEDDKKATSVDL